MHEKIVPSWYSVAKYKLASSMWFLQVCLAGRWWRTPLIPALGRQRQVDLYEFETSLIYRASSRTGTKTTEKPCFEKAKKKKSLLFPLSLS